MKANFLPPEYTIIPFRGSSLSMNRLRSTIGNQKTNHIALFLFERTLDAVLKNKLKPLILTADYELNNSIKLPQGEIIIDSGKSLNKAISELVMDYSSERLVLVMPDFPGMVPDLIKKIIHLSTLFPHIVAPTGDGGTAASILPNDFYHQSYFGINSSAKIEKALTEGGFEYSKIICHELRRDLDDLEDLKAWKPQLDHFLKLP